jgi:hypothetical protein
MMFERFSKSWELVKASYGVLRQDRELMIFPLISMIGVILVTITFIFPLFATGLIDALSSEGEMSTGQQIAGGVIAFLYYFVIYTVIIFSNVALIGAAMIRLDGGEPTIADGFRIASSHAGAILGYAAISATVGMILQMVRGDNDNIVGRIVASLLSTAWNLITFLVIPVLIVENVGPIEAIKRSGSLLKKTWGEQVIGGFSMSIISFLVMLAAFIVIGLPVLFVTNLLGIIGLGIFVVVLVMVAIGLFFSALNSIFMAALYKYATEGTAGTFFDESMLVGAFKPKRG